MDLFFCVFWPNTTVGPPWVYFDLPNLDLVCFGTTYTRNRYESSNEQLVEEGTENYESEDED